MSRPKWPKWLRSGKSKSKSPGKQDVASLNGTRRIVRAVVREAVSLPPREQPKRTEPLEVRRESMVVHINFKKLDVLLGKFDATHPVTKEKRKTRRFSKSDIFYRKDGKLLDDDNWVRE